MLVSVVALLAGCQPLTATVLPTPQIIRVQLTTELTAWEPSLQNCAERLPGIGLVVNVISAGQIDLSAADFTLRLGLPSGQDQMTPAPYPPIEIGMEKVMVIVNPDNPVSALSPAQIEAIYSGQIAKWDGFEPMTQNTPALTANPPIKVWTYPSGDDVRLVFDQAFLPDSSYTSQVYIAPDGSAMRNAIAQDPDSIGFILASQVDSSVRTVTLDGTPSSKLEQPVLALSTKAPQGQVKQLLLCLQGN